MAKFSAADMEVPGTKAGAMSYLQLLTGVGYGFWHRGAVRHEKALGFAEKMAELYPVGLGETQRSRNKARQIANVKLVMFADMKMPGEVVWYLLATPGKGVIHEREKMKAVADHPLLWLDQYQIERRARTELSGGKRRKKVRWTWVLQPSYRLALKDTIKGYCATAEARKSLYLLFDNLRRMPLFSGVRDELVELDRYGAETWRKTRKEPYPGHVGDLPYITRVPIFEGLTLGALVEAMRQQDAEKKAAGEALAAAALRGQEPPQSLTQSLRHKHGTAEKEFDPDHVLSNPDPD